MQNHFNNNQNQNNRQEWMRQMQDTKPHNFIQKTDQDMYGQNNQYGQQYGGQYYGGQQQTQGPTYNKPFVAYGVNSNQRPVVVSQGGCCCSVM